MTLPSTESFFKDAGILSPAPKAPPPVVTQEMRNMGVSPEMRKLLADYCSQFISAQSLEEVNFEQLARRLGAPKNFIEEAAKVCDSEGALWRDVINDRIKRASAAKIFRDSGWERLESLAVNRLVELAERNLIRDPGELLAVASHARRANEPKSGGGGSGNTVNINLGGESMDGSNGLPPAGAKMTIDLSPRMAEALKERSQRTEEGRVIDGKMLTAMELRSALELTKNPAPQLDQEQELFNEIEGEGN